MLLKQTIIVIVLSLAITGCAARKPAAAHLVVPVECVDEIRLAAPLDLGKDGTTAKKGSFKVRYHCTAVARSK
jgi:hypothetical protein